MVQAGGVSKAGDRRPFLDSAVLRADALLQANTHGGLRDAHGLARDLIFADGATRSAVDAMLTPVERGQVARLLDGPLGLPGMGTVALTSAPSPLGATVSVQPPTARDAGGLEIEVQPSQLGGAVAAAQPPELGAGAAALQAGAPGQADAAALIVQAGGPDGPAQANLSVQVVAAGVHVGVDARPPGAAGPPPLVTEAALIGGQNLLAQTRAGVQLPVAGGVTAAVQAGGTTGGAVEPRVSIAAFADARGPGPQAGWRGGGVLPGEVLAVGTAGTAGGPGVTVSVRAAESLLHWRQDNGLPSGWRNGGGPGVFVEDRPTLRLIDLAGTAVSISAGAARMIADSGAGQRAASVTVSEASIQAAPDRLTRATQTSAVRPGLAGEAVARLQVVLERPGAAAAFREGLAQGLRAATGGQADLAGVFATLRGGGEAGRLGQLVLGGLGAAWPDLKALYARAAAQGALAEAEWFGQTAGRIAASLAGLPGVIGQSAAGLTGNSLVDLSNGERIAAAAALAAALAELLGESGPLAGDAGPARDPHAANMPENYAVGLPTPLQRFADAPAETGERRHLDASSFDAWGAAEDAYERIRRNPRDVAAIARHTGWSVAAVGRVKRHIFLDAHALDRGMQRLDAHPEIANAWDRLEQGDFRPGDVALLRRARFEARFEAIFRTDYRTANDAATRAGRAWGG